MLFEDSGFIPLPMALFTSPVGRLGLAPAVRSFGVLDSLSAHRLSAQHCTASGRARLGREELADQIAS